MSRLLRAVALVVTDRRWAAPLTAVALGFGLFIGVAIGPSAAGTIAGAPQIIEIPGFSGGADDEAGEGGEPAAAFAGPVGGGAAEASSLGVLPASTPIGSAPTPAPPPAVEEPAPAPAAAPEGEAPPEPEATELEGVVVHANPAAGSYTLAIKGGELVAVHAAKLPLPGTELRLPARRLSNGTFAEHGAPGRSGRAAQEKPARPGKAARASFKGVVTFLDPDPAAPSYTVSGRGASIPVGVRPDPAGAPPQLPELGAYVTVGVAIEPRRPDSDESAASRAWSRFAPHSETNLAHAPRDAGRIAPRRARGPEAAAADPAGQPTRPAAQPADPAGQPTRPAAQPADPAAPPPCALDPAAPPQRFEPGATLWQREVEAEGEPYTYLDLAGILTATCPASGQLLLSADDIRAGERDIALSVPQGISLRELEVGDSYLATAELGEDGGLTLAGLASDEHTRGADDPSSSQGDLKRSDAPGGR